MQTSQIELPELRAEMSRRGWSRQQLADASGLSSATIALAMRGTMSDRTRDAILSGLGPEGAARVQGGCLRCLDALVPLDIVFDGPPSQPAPRFIEAEVEGVSVKAGEWVDLSDGRWALRLFRPAGSVVRGSDEGK